MGGMTIMSLAGQHPELFDPASPSARVKAVGLLDTSGHRPDEHAFGLRGPIAKLWLKQWQAALALMVSDPEKAEHARRSGSRLAVRISGWLNLGKGADRRLATFTEAMTAGTPVQVVGDFWATLDAHDQRESLAALAAVPTLVLCGDRDRLTPPSDSRALAAAIPGARLLELRGAGHCAMLEQPEAVNAAILDLITSAVADAPLPATVATRGEVA
jgi:pimeloyl-ACP methyl ester carboxylesterase